MKRTKPFLFSNILPLCMNCTKHQDIFRFCTDLYLIIIKYVALTAVALAWCQNVLHCQISYTSYASYQLYHLKINILCKTFFFLCSKCWTSTLIFDLCFSGLWTLIIHVCSDQVKAENYRKLCLNSKMS